MIEEIEFIEDFGHIKAFILQDVRQLESRTLEFPQVYFKSINDHCLEYGIDKFIYISDVYVMPEFRKQGFASEMFESFLKLYNQPMFLIAGSAETPKKFDIISFYEEYSFEIICEDFIFPLMFFNL